MKPSYNVIGVIPARYESTRLKKKLAREILGKPVLQWTWENACNVRSLDKLIIACDDKVLFDLAKSFGAEAVMTSTEHDCGTDRIIEAVSDIDTRVVINIQADEPLVHPSMIEGLAQEMLDDEKLMMATIKKRITSDAEMNDPNVVKVVTDRDDYALYFSRHSIPYDRDNEGIERYKHLGIYAYTKDFLYTFKNLPTSKLEQAEKLEQLRALEDGVKIKVIETKFETRSVDIKEDIAIVEKLLKERSNNA